MGAEPALVRVPPDGLGAVRGDDLAQMSQHCQLEDALSRDGVAVTRARRAPRRPARPARPVSRRPRRPGAQARAASNDGRAHARSLVAAFRAHLPRRPHRRGVRRRALRFMPFAPCFGEAGAIGRRGRRLRLGRDAELRELQVIVSEPGAAAQDVHSDSKLGQRRDS